MALRKPQKNVEALESLIRYPSQKSFFFAFENQKVTRNLLFSEAKPYTCESDCLYARKDRHRGRGMKPHPSYWSPPSGGRKYEGGWRLQRGWYDH